MDYAQDEATSECDEYFDRLHFYQRDKMIPSSSFFSQMTSLQTDEYYIIGAGKESQSTLHNYFHDHNKSLKSALAEPSNLCPRQTNTRKAVKAINLHRQWT